MLERYVQPDLTLRFSMPDGPEGTRETLKQMRRLVQIGRGDTQLRKFAQSIVRQCQPKDWWCELSSLFEWVRWNIRYTLDPNGIELIQSPRQTLVHRAGDCDDMSIMVATLLECMGHPCRFVAMGFGAIGEYSHVLVQCAPAAGEDWVSMDTTEDHPMGWFPPGVTCQMIAEI